ncbi:class I SAM-dependent methyltransferase [Calidifontibacter sp. DB0510]|uniref:Class I SAM-dependent methyltransferase n=1 Tax=Metallococcus carri TaxID=1656884 RepID=A0A967B0V6_9MICO|nr:class I SAM-dependent methyltransferase [Metallococcus carri]NOP36470.1 class I SAM-dependent methyltransferase [Calidifontibacter sp. DB2511S]
MLPDRAPDTLAADLRAANFTADGLQAHLGSVAAAALHREQVVPALRATDDDRPLSVLIRFFCLGMPMPAGLLDRALPSTGAAGLVAHGLATRDGEALAPAYDLRPYGDEDHDWWVLSDLSEVATRAPLREDHVLGIGGASTTLASWTPRRRARRALDLGTGSGVQTLHLAQHCDQIVATDLSERACATAQFTASINGLDMVEVRRGSLFEPVAGERFDLIVSNPPFVITPRAPGVPEYEYRDGGLVGDAIVRTVVQQAEQHLQPGGIAQLLGNWEVPRGRDWADVVGDWLAPTGLDAWVVQRDSQDPAEYAELWASDGGHRTGEIYERMYAAWLDDFAAREVERIGFGIITLRRPETDRPAVRRLEEVGGPVASPMGPTIDAGLRVLEWTATHEVLDARWMVAADVTEERFGRPGAADPSVIRLTQGGGLRHTVQIDTATAAFVSVADGELTARQAYAAIAALLDQDAEELLAEQRPIVQGLVERGFLVPVEGE